MTTNTNLAPSNRMFYSVALRPSYGPPQTDNRLHSAGLAQGANSTRRAPFSGGVYDVGPWPVHGLLAFTRPLHLERALAAELSRLRAAPVEVDAGGAR